MGLFDFLFGKKKTSSSKKKTEKEAATKNKSNNNDDTMQTIINIDAMNNLSGDLGNDSNDVSDNPSDSSSF